MIRPVPSVAGLAPYALADLPEGLTSLAQNESFLPPSPAALEAASRTSAEAMLYPDPDWRDLRAAIAEEHGLDPATVLCGAGSMELIGCLVRAFTGPGDAVLGTQYGYHFLATAARQAGARHDIAPEEEFSVSVDALLSAVRPETRIVFVCNPGNPTGTRIPNGEIQRLRAEMPGNVLLVVDQAYAEFDAQNARPIFDLVARGDTVVTRTFSKAFALAGCRVGWGIFPEGIGGEVRKLLNPNNVSGISQAMAAAAMRDRVHTARIVHETGDLRHRFVARLKAAGLRPPVSHTNFVLIPFADPGTASRADKALRDCGILLRGMAGYGLPQCLRATIGPPDVMERAADILTRFMGETP